MSTAPVSIVNDKIHRALSRPIRATIVPNPNPPMITTMTMDLVEAAATVVLWRGPHAMDTVITIVPVTARNNKVKVSRNACLTYDNVDMAPCDYNR